MSTLLCMRRRGGFDGAATVDPLWLWYVDGFAVERHGRCVGTVEVALPTVDGDVAGALVVRTPGGGSAVLDAAAVVRVRFRERRLEVTAEPAPFDVEEPRRRDAQPASA